MFYLKSKTTAPYYYTQLILSAWAMYTTTYTNVRHTWRAARANVYVTRYYGRFKIELFDRRAFDKSIIITVYIHWEMISREVAIPKILRYGVYFWDFMIWYRFYSPLSPLVPRSSCCCCCCCVALTFFSILFVQFNSRYLLSSTNRLQR